MKKKIVGLMIVGIMLAAIGVVTVQACCGTQDEIAGKVCKASLEAKGYTCPWTSPWYWPFSDCSWYALTCAQSAGG